MIKAKDNERSLMKLSATSTKSLRTLNCLLKILCNMNIMDLSFYHSGSTFYFVCHLKVQNYIIKNKTLNLLDELCFGYLQS